MQVLPPAPVPVDHRHTFLNPWSHATPVAAGLAAAMESQELRDFVASYASELADLTFNSKPIINTLTMLASENLAAASSIAAAIERHILLVSTDAKPWNTPCHIECN